MPSQTVFFIPGDEEASLTCYFSQTFDHRKNPAILVIPGGGYACVCDDREGHNIAEAFLPYGFNTFVLRYTAGRKHPYPAQLIEAAKAVQYIRDHGEEWNVDVAHIFAVGFSAGGHLCGSLGLLGDDPEVVKALGDRESYRIQGMMLCYAVISANIEKPEMGTLRNVWCTDTPTEEQLARVSLETHVTKDAPPLFMMHTAEDPLVDVRNALVLANAYKAEGVPFEMHIYPFGTHGIALANSLTSGGRPNMEDKEVEKWVGEAVAFAKRFC